MPRVSERSCEFDCEGLDVEEVLASAEVEVMSSGCWRCFCHVCATSVSISTRSFWWEVARWSL